MDWDSFSARFRLKIFFECVNIGEWLPHIRRIECIPMPPLRKFYGGAKLTLSSVPEALTLDSFWFWLH